MQNFIISASILSADLAELASQVKQADGAGVDWFHIDVMDGHFVPNISFGQILVETCRKLTTLPLDVHLMIENPDNYTEGFKNAGTDRMSIHVEGNPNIHRSLQKIKELGCKTGIVINPGTPVSSISSILPLVDLVLVMTVNPGFSGQDFLSEMIPKIIETRRMIDKLDHICRLQVDGGITSQTLVQTLNAGADTFVSASAIFCHPKGIRAGVSELKQAIHKEQ